MTNNGRMRYFVLVWSDGKKQVVQAEDAGQKFDTLANAMVDAGIDADSIKELDYHYEVDKETAKEFADEENVKTE